VHVTSRGQRDERRGGCAPRSPAGGPNGKRLPARTRRRRLAHPFGLGAGSPKVRGRSQSAQSPSGDCNLRATRRASAVISPVAISPIPFRGLQRTQDSASSRAFTVAGVAISPIPFRGLQPWCVFCERSNAIKSFSVAISPIPFRGLQRARQVLNSRSSPPVARNERRNQPNPLQGIATFVDASATVRISASDPARRNQPNPLQGIATPPPSFPGAVRIARAQSPSGDCNRLAPGPVGPGRHVSRRNQPSGARRNQPNPLQGIATQCPADESPARVPSTNSPISQYESQSVQSGDCNIGTSQSAQSPSGGIATASPSQSARGLRTDASAVAISPIPFRGLQR
jgi:hypothetical protein